MELSYPAEKRTHPRDSQSSMRPAAYRLVALWSASRRSMCQGVLLIACREISLLRRRQRQSGPLFWGVSWTKRCSTGCCVMQGNFCQFRNASEAVKKSVEDGRDGARPSKITGKTACLWRWRDDLRVVRRFFHSFSVTQGGSLPPRAEGARIPPPVAQGW